MVQETTQQRRKKQGLCLRCGGTPVEGKTLCEECAKKKAQYNAKYWPQVSKTKKEVYNKRKLEKENKKYQERKEQGLCIRCGKPAVNGTLLCTQCKVKDQIYKQKRKGLKNG